MSAARDGVDVIVRFHNLARLGELRRAVFSLAGQEFRPIRILLVLQRFSDADVATVRAALAPLLALPEQLALEVLRFDAQEPLDARSALMNLGFAAATARYVALLDYDDVLYPEAYRMLSDRLRESGAAIAFGNIGVAMVDVHEGFFHAYAHQQPFSGNSLADLFRQNFCPIHSFMVDRTRVPAGSCASSRPSPSRRTMNSCCGSARRQDPTSRW
ncbi:glycosyltransferase [Paeniroseomonas aquatica]|uniref:glycosyltransferase n=1 Tax=Paeniroseomonas aquatica TaxID=373043 RepID=UPI00360AD7E7